MAIITISELNKNYSIFNNQWRRLLHIFGFCIVPNIKSKIVLRNINFTVNPGDSIGIVGMNGSGKSTLLKVISGITKPTSGKVKIDGKVSAILELGLGFHPDYTGRQNLIMAGQLLGISNQTIMMLMDNMIDFSELGENIDQPYRIYSSGMQARLAFSIATAIRPDILIVDEALSVGDEHFQHKCFQRIREYQQMGTSLLMVSHDKNALLSTCNRLILLNQGEIFADGEPEMVFNIYNQLIANADRVPCAKLNLFGRDARQSFGSGEISLSLIDLIEEKSRKSINVIEVGAPVILKLLIYGNMSVAKVVVGYSIRNKYGQVVFGTNTAQIGKEIGAIDSGEVREIDFSFCMNLGVGHYSISTAIVNSETHLDENYEWIDFAYQFEVVNTQHPRFDGLVYLDQQLVIL